MDCRFHGGDRFPPTLCVNACMIQTRLLIRLEHADVELLLGPPMTFDNTSKYLATLLPVGRSGVTDVASPVSIGPL